MKLFIITLSFLVLVGCGNSENSGSKAYCDMHKIWLDSDGEYGWPDYNDNYEEVCK